MGLICELGLEIRVSGIDLGIGIGIGIGAEEMKRGGWCLSVAVGVIGGGGCYRWWWCEERWPVVGVIGGGGCYQREKKVRRDEEIDEGFCLNEIGF